MAFLLRGVHAVDPQVGLDEVVDVLIDKTDIAAVGTDLDAPGECEEIDADGRYLVPGLVDMHVHFRDPGFEYKETIETGSRAAVHGGFTDVATMPNTDPVTDTGAEIRYQIDRGRVAGHVHIRPIGALTRGEGGEALAEIGDMVLEGACAFSDDGHGVQSAGMMRTCMDYVSQFDRAVLAHCEIESLTTNGVINEGRASTRLGMFGWPALGEELEIYRDLELTKLTGCDYHVCHITTRRGLELVRAAKAEGLPVTCEVTPHHLLLTDEMARTYSPLYKVNPPLRTAEDVEAVREALADGTIDVIGTDHAPHPVEDKDCEWQAGAFGMTGLETALSVLIETMVATGRMTWRDIARTMSSTPARIGRLSDQGCELEVGAPANITVVDPEVRRTVDASAQWTSSTNTPYAGMELPGQVMATFLHGRPTVLNGAPVEAPAGSAHA